jgi:hypothetical protein
VCVAGELGRDSGFVQQQLRAYRRRKEKEEGTGLGGYAQGCM